MARTTGPSFGVALVLYLLTGLGADASVDMNAVNSLKMTLSQNFQISIVALVPLVVVFGLAYKKVPPIPTILFGALLGGVMAVALHPAVVIVFADASQLSPGLAMTKGAWLAMADGYSAATGVSEVDDLLSSGGMSSMLNTIWLII